MHNDALLLLAALLCLLLLHTSHTRIAAAAAALLIFLLISTLFECSAHFFTSNFHNFSQNERRDAAHVADDTKQSSRYVLLQADGSQHTHAPISNLHGCCGHTALLLLKCALLSLFFSSFSFSLFLFSEKRNDLRHGVRWLSVIVHHGVAQSAGQLLRVSAGIQR